MPKLGNQKTEFLTEDQFQRLLEVIDSWPHEHTARLVKFALFTLRAIWGTTWHLALRTVSLNRLD